MIFRKLWLVNRNQGGFALIEIIAALAIMALIGIGAATATAQVCTQSTKNSDYTTASRHTMNAIHWISRDVMMAQTVETNGASGLLPLNLNWVDWDNSIHQVTYTLQEDGDLKRGYSVDGGEPSETVVAQYINSDTETTNCEFSGGVLTLKVTATVDEGKATSQATKIREITPRPGL
jgi:prepilin-type N-terminal cleavage/methylation domain-containing protein